MKNSYKAKVQQISRYLIDNGLRLSRIHGYRVILPKYDGRKKLFKYIDREDYSLFCRHIANRDDKNCKKDKVKPTFTQYAKYLMDTQNPKHGNYCKALFAFKNFYKPGETHYYLCSPTYGGSDYNKIYLGKNDNKHTDALVKVLAANQRRIDNSIQK